MAVRAAKYSTAPADNVVSRLQKRIDAGQVKLDYEDKHGYLRALLRELQVPESSQMLVFSKTSLQRHRITPKTPRALYFSDDVYVGYCRRGDMLEVSAADPKLGGVFYTLSQEPAERPRSRAQFSIGETIKVVSGPLSDFSGEISEVNEDAQRLKVLVSIFGRETPVEVGFDQVKKV